MSVSGKFRALGAGPQPQPVDGILARGLELVQTLGLKLQQLDELMLAGKPDEIAEAASAVDLALKESTPLLAEIGALMNRLGAANLLAASAQLRLEDEADAAHLAEALRGALLGFARRSFNANKRARELSRSLSAALQSLQTIGAQEGGRLIAEA